MKFIIMLINNREQNIKIDRLSYRDKIMYECNNNWKLL